MSYPLQCPMHVTDANMHVKDVNMHVTDVHMHVADVNIHVVICDMHVTNAMFPMLTWENLMLGKNASHVDMRVIHVQGWLGASAANPTGLVLTPASTQYTLAPVCCCPPLPAAQTMFWLERDF